MSLHVYRNEVIEWYVAETLEEAVELARKYLAEAHGTDEEDMDLGLRQESDSKVLICDHDDDGKVSKTCAEWAQDNGKGFLFSTEW